MEMKSSPATLAAVVVVVVAAAAAAAVVTANRLSSNLPGHRWSPSDLSDWPSRDLGGRCHGDRPLVCVGFASGFFLDLQAKSRGCDRGVVGVVSCFALIFGCLALFLFSRIFAPSSSSSSSSEKSSVVVISRSARLLPVLADYFRPSKQAVAPSPTSFSSSSSSSTSSSSSAPSSPSSPSSPSPSALQRISTTGEKPAEQPVNPSAHPSTIRHQRLPHPPLPPPHPPLPLLANEMAPHRRRRHRRFLHPVVAVAVAAFALSLPVADASMASCSTNQWREASRRCSENMEAVLEEIRVSDSTLSNDVRLNMTCREWDRTNACFQQLMQRCSGDPHIIRNLNERLERFVIYSLPCRDPVKYQRTFSECLLPELKPTWSCTEAIDKYLHRYVSTREYRTACRVIASSMRCFLKSKNKIRERCSDDDTAEEYHHNFIQPLVDQMRSTALAHCSLSPTYKQYFVQSPPSAALASTSDSTLLRRPMAFEGSVLLPLSALLLRLGRPF